MRQGKGQTGTRDGVAHSNDKQFSFNEMKLDRRLGASPRAPLRRPDPVEFTERAGASRGAVDLLEKVRQLPPTAGVYLYRNAEGVVIYVGKAKNLRARVRSYFLQASTADAKTGTLIREAVDLDFILVDNEREALALENNLIKQHLPRFNVLLRDDKTYPYIKLTRETYPRIYVTRRLRPDGAEYFGPYFPAHLAYRIAHFIHKHFLVPSCWVDLTRNHARPCLQFHIHRCLGPCVSGLTSAVVYGEAVKDVRLFLAGHP